MADVLVVQNAATEGPGRLTGWLEAAGLAVRVHPAYAAPGELRRAPGEAVVVLGGPMSAYPPTAAFVPTVIGLLEDCLAHGVPVLGVCLGAQLLALAAGGRVAAGEHGPELGAGLVRPYPPAAGDPLLGGWPAEMVPVVQWHWDAVLDAGPDATALAGSDRYHWQAFRVGAGAWGLQFHVEAPPALVGLWAHDDATALRAAGLDPAAVLAEVHEVDDAVAATGRELLARFAAVVARR